MSVVEIPALVETLDTELVQLFGVAPPRVGRPPGPQPISRVQWINLANNLNSMYPGWRPFPANLAGFDQYQYETNVVNAIHYVNTWLGQALSASVAGFGAVKQYVDAEVGFVAGALRSLAAGGSASAVGQAAAMVRTAEAAATAQVNRLRSDLNAWVGALQRDDAHIEANLAAYARGVANGARAHADQLFAKAEQDLNVWAGALVTADRTNQAQARNYTDAQAQALTRDMAAQRNTLEQEIASVGHQAETFALGAAASAAAAVETRVLTQVSPELARIGTEVDTCLAPMCDTVAPRAPQLGKLGGALKALEDVGIVALLAALVGEAVHDPVGTATVVADAGGWTSDLGVELAQAVG